MPQRYCPSINLIKFICAIGIIWVHQSAIIENYTDFPFASNGTLVELFYSITGLLTYSHFYYQKDTEDIMHYCAKKFIRLFPYSCFSIISCFLISNIDIIMKGSIHNLCYEARDLPLELLLLRNAAAETTRIKTYDGILWFMSAMFIVLPLFCFVCTVLKKHALMISVLFCELWYMSTNAQHYSYDWQSLCRAMAGLMLGVIIFHIALRIEQTRVWGGHSQLLKY